MIKRIFLIFILGITGIPFVHAEKSKKPNVLFIAINDLNDWVGDLKGHHQIITPHMQKLASEGVSLTFCV